MSKRNGLVVLLVLMIGLVITVYLMYTHEKADQVTVTPDFSLSVAELLTAFENDSAAASKQYIDKVIELKGIVKSVDTAGALILGAMDAAGEIVISIDPRHKAGLNSASPGEQVITQGICSSFSAGKQDPADLLSGLGSSINFRYGGLKNGQ